MVDTPIPHPTQFINWRDEYSTWRVEYEKNNFTVDRKTIPNRHSSCSDIQKLIVNGRGNSRKKSCYPNTRSPIRDEFSCLIPKPTCRKGVFFVFSWERKLKSNYFGASLRTLSMLRFKWIFCKWDDLPRSFTFAHSVFKNFVSAFYEPRILWMQQHLKLRLKSCFFRTLVNCKQNIWDIYWIILISCPLLGNPRKTVTWF